MRSSSVTLLKTTPRKEGRRVGVGESERTQTRAPPQQLGKVIRIRLIRQMAHKTVIRHILETHSGLIRGC
eukprot:SAG25_NODE_862_length_5023_cov_2.854010_8_plen_69_part_01